MTASRRDFLLLAALWLAAACRAGLPALSPEHDPAHAGAPVPAFAAPPDVLNTSAFDTTSRGEDHDHAAHDHSAHGHDAHDAPRSQAQTEESAASEDHHEHHRHGGPP